MHLPTAPVPGRLRLWFSQLRHQGEQIAQLATTMRAVHGVLLVEASPLTGGLLIHYDAATGKTAAFWHQIEAALVAHELFLDPRAMARRAPGALAGPRSPKAPPRPPREANTGAVQAPSPGSELGRSLGAGIASGLVGKLVERSAIALVAALL